LQFKLKELGNNGVIVENKVLNIYSGPHHDFGHDVEDVFARLHGGEASLATLPSAVHYIAASQAKNNPLRCVHMTTLLATWFQTPL
jgi:hypothetical protein